CELKPIGVAAAKARLNRATEDVGVDPNPGELGMTRLKVRSHALDDRTVATCKMLGGAVWRGERRSKLGNSWFSAKTIEVVRQTYADGGRALDRLGGREVYQT